MKNLEKPSQKLSNLILFAIFIFAFVVRIWYLKDDSLTFGYDQARDASIAKQILSGDIKIQGPPSSAPGLYHGVFYYYFLSPAYLFGSGSPVFTAYYMAFFNSLVVFLVFLLAKFATQNFKIALLSAFLYAISFESTQYATWLSNPTIAILTVPLMYLGLWLWINSTKDKSNVFAPIITAIGLGLSIQSEIFLAYHVIPLLIWLSIYHLQNPVRENVGVCENGRSPKCVETPTVRSWVLHKNNITKKSLFYFIVFLVFSVFTLILCEIKFGFNSISALESLAVSSSGNLAYAKSVGDYLILYLNQIGRIFAFNTYPGNIGYGGIAVIILGIYSFKNLKNNPYPAFLATWLFSHLSVVTIGGTSTPFLMVGIGPAVSLILAFYLYKLFNKQVILAIFILCVIIYGNLNYVITQNKSGSTLFSIQKDMLLSKQIAAIDYTYRIANGKDFSINSLTSPLWINIVWTYLYKWYGLNTYGYLPSWHGKDQVGQLDSLNRIDTPLIDSFLILEPMAGIPSMYLPIAIGEEEVDTKLVEEKSFGEIIVQHRKLK